MWGLKPPSLTSKKVCQFVGITVYSKYFLPAEGENGEDHEGVGDDDDEQGELKYDWYVGIFLNIYIYTFVKFLAW